MAKAAHIPRIPTARKLGGKLVSSGNAAALAISRLRSGGRSREEHSSLLEQQAISGRQQLADGEVGFFGFEEPLPSSNLHISDQLGDRVYLGTCDSAAYCSPHLSALPIILAECFDSVIAVILLT